MSLSQDDLAEVAGRLAAKVRELAARYPTGAGSAGRSSAPEGDLAEAGHYPAIDIEASISRVMPAVVKREHLRSAQRFRQVYSAYRQQRDLIAVGAYQKGSDPQVDHAIAMWPKLRDFLQQEVDAPTTLNDAISGLETLTAGGTP